MIVHRAGPSNASPRLTNRDSYPSSMSGPHCQSSGICFAPVYFASQLSHVMKNRLSAVLVSAAGHVVGVLQAA